MDFIRRTYAVPAKRGARLRFKDGLNGDRDGTVVGARGAYLRVRMDGEKRIRTLHPTWRIEYLGRPNVRGKAQPRQRLSP